MSLLGPASSFPVPVAASGDVGVASATAVIVAQFRVTELKTTKTSFGKERTPCCYLQDVHNWTFATRQLHLLDVVEDTVAKTSKAMEIVPRYCRAERLLSCQISFLK